LVSDLLVGAVKNWAVSDQHSFSDHRFKETLLSLDSPLAASNTAFPPWWTQQLSVLRTNCRGLFYRAKAVNEDTNWQNYKHELASYNGSWSDSTKESLDLLLDAHFPGNQQTGHPPERSSGEGIKLDLLLPDRNIKWSLQSFKSY